MTSIAISSGHGLYVRGARGNPVPPQLDEVDEARRVVDRVAEYLDEVGDVAVFHDNKSHSQSENLNTIVNWHNQQHRDLDISVHFNCYDHSAHGVEVLYVTQEGLARRMSEAISVAAGFTNRGAKYRSDLAFLNGTDMPAILIETCFCDHTGDCQKYGMHFEHICQVIAEILSGQSISEPPGQPPERPEDLPPRPLDPTDVPLEDRPTVSLGDSGSDVEDLQKLLPRFDGVIDGDFGPITEGEVTDYQSTRGLDIDGICGPQTWAALYENKPPLPPPAPPPHALTGAEQRAIMQIANDSAIADYSWQDRGHAPLGYTQGMALAFAQTYRKLAAGHPAAHEMAKARLNSDKDALNVYRAEFTALGLSNESAGADTLRHLYALMLGSGMRESSGRHCEGRDMSADNVTSDTAEAGLFQTSYNAHSASSPEFDNLMNEYGDPRNEATCYLDAFSEDVECSSSDWENYGSGQGYAFQRLCKECPSFAVETHALTLRNLCNHYGPIVRKEVELKRAAEEMFAEVQAYMDSHAPETAVASVAPKKRKHARKRRKFPPISLPAHLQVLDFAGMDRTKQQVQSNEISDLPCG
jgi:hypothetical protein